MNAISVIKPYRWEGMWVFDDPRVELDKEPFVSGADVIIDAMVANIPGAADGFRLIFSGTPFPGAQHEFGVGVLTEGDTTEGERKGTEAHGERGKGLHGGGA